MASHQTVVLAQDPQWLLKLVVVSVLLAALLTIASYLAKAQRRTFLLTFPIALSALLASHFVARIAMSSLGLGIAVATMIAILFVGVRFLLIARPLVSVVAVTGVAVVFIAGLVTALAIGAW